MPVQLAFSSSSSQLNFNLILNFIPGVAVCRASSSQVDLAELYKVAGFGTSLPDSCQKGVHSARASGHVANLCVDL